MLLNYDYRFIRKGFFLYYMCTFTMYNNEVNFILFHIQKYDIKYTYNYWNVIYVNTFTL